MAEVQRNAGLTFVLAIIALVGVVGAAESGSDERMFEDIALSVPGITSVPDLAIGSIDKMAQTSLYPPQSHNGQDLILNDGDSIWGLHTGINRLVVPTTASVRIRALSSVPDTGWVELHANEIVVSGTLNAVGSGFWGGAGGGTGGGAAATGWTGWLIPGHYGAGGIGVPFAGNGVQGDDGNIGLPGGASGGRGGLGGTGGGPGGGRGGAGGTAAFAGAGTPGGSGNIGGYVAPGGNGDATTNLAVYMGSGGGGGGGGAGGGVEAPGPTGKIAGGGGGSGAAGASGGGAIRLYALSSLRIAGAVNTRGALLGPGGMDGEDGKITAQSIIGGFGGDGADSSFAGGTGLAGLAGHSVELDTTGRGFSGGNGGRSGIGGGGGVLIVSLLPNGIDLTSGTIDARGGAGQTANGGTVKIFFAGDDPTSGAGTILAGRLYKQGTLNARHWNAYR